MGCRALVIEDDHALADVLRMKLVRDGHKVSIAKHQREAYHLLDKHRFDFVLLDLRLPTSRNDMDPNSEVGFAILDHIRDRFSPDELPVIIMTAYEETSQTAVRALKAFANDYIQKPFEDSSASLDDKIAAIVRHLEAGKPSSGHRQTPQPDKRHRIVFKRECVEINGMAITGRFHALLALLGSRTLMLTPAPANANGSAMTGKEMAQVLKIGEPSVRQTVTRFRKFIANEQEKLNGRTIGPQEIIRNNRDWKGYEINFETSYIICE